MDASAPRRGDVWWANLDPVIGPEIAKRRPVVVIGHDIVNARRRTVIVVPLSSSPTPYPPITVPVSCLGQTVVAVIDQAGVTCLCQARHLLNQHTLSSRQIDQ